MASEIKPFAEVAGEPQVRGFVHEPAQSNGDAVALTHGAGANCQSNLLAEMGNALAELGFMVLRFDLPFRQMRRYGPPHPGSAERDRDGVRRAIAVMKEKVKGRVFVGGHSYGGRQATMLIAEEPQLADGLLLLSYPLHPPKKPEQLRTSHFPKMKRPAYFVHGTSDPFGTIAEMKAALKLIPAAHELLEIEGAGHELLGKKAERELPARIARGFSVFSNKL